MAIIEEVEDSGEEVAEPKSNASTELQEEKSSASTKKVSKAPAAPAAPPAPEFKISSLAPMVAMLALQKYDLEQLGYVRHVEVAFCIVQVLCFSVLYMTYMKIKARVDDGKKIKIPEVKQFGQVVAPAKEQTTKEYDMEKMMEAVKQPVIGALVLGGIYYKWGSLMPLVLQLIMTPTQLYEAPLTQIYFFGKDVKRPFPAPSLLGLPQAPAPATEEEAEEDVKEEDKKEK
eukprot:CAMPEP_0169119102 /NCGR_PEP_ID=MMETSP1015-20121227/31364_1 /TAXON_ID=342587 /ORGANISM="Karlodinium micrum, Strain CCMP2283" /LENGTH=229 /DNA_ID=CAMNT_0009181933 /DNA_START=71 /DNA_END=760 /DNA_ORIENTATION=+